MGYFLPRITDECSRERLQSIHDWAMSKGAEEFYNVHYELLGDLARHRNTPAEILNYIVYEWPIDLFPSVWADLASRTDVGYDKDFIRAEDEGVVLAYVSNPFTPPDALLEIWDDRDCQSCEVIDTLIERLSFHGFEVIR